MAGKMAEQKKKRILIFLSAFRGIKMVDEWNVFLYLQKVTKINHFFFLAK